MIRAYRPIAVAEVCHPFEAAEWIAFGRLPEEYVAEFRVGPGERVWREVRKEIRALVAGDYLVGDDSYTPEELQAVGLEVDYVRYLDVLFSYGARDLNELFFGTESDKMLEAHRAIPLGPPTPEAHEDTLLMEEVRIAFHPYEERARLMVLLALMDGRLTAEGFQIPEGWTVSDHGFSSECSDDSDGYDFEDLYERATVGHIPCRAWTNTPEIWQIGSSEAVSYLPGYVGAWINTEQLLKVFPNPILPPQEFAGQRIGTTVLSGQEGIVQSLPSPAKRGRPKKAGGAVEKAVKNEFRRRLRAGLLPDKNESTIAECMSWAEEILEESITRTTAQRYLADVFEEAERRKIGRP